MTMESSKPTSVSSAVAQAKAAFEAGKLNEYPPLAASGAGIVTATVATSWGPQMKR